MPDLPNKFWKTPETARTTMATKDVTELLLEKDGKIVAKGVFWTIQSKRIGPGVYEVWLEPKTPVEGE